MAPAQHGSPPGSGRRRSVPRPGMAEARRSHHGRHADSV
jgi:hypothetical protein